MTQAGWDNWTKRPLEKAVFWFIEDEALLRCACGGIWLSYQPEMALQQDYPTQIPMRVRKEKTMSYHKFIKISGFTAMLTFVVTTLFNIGLSTKFVPASWEYSGYLLVYILFAFVLTGIYFRQVDQAGYLGWAGFVVSMICVFLSIIWTGYASLVFPVLRSQFPDAIRPVLQGPLGAATMINMYLGFLGNLLFYIATLRAGIFPKAATWIVIAGLVIAWLPVPMNLGTIITTLGLAWMGYTMWKGDQQAAPAAQVAAIV